MKVYAKDIRPELRLAGRFQRLMMPLSSEKKLRFANRFMDIFIKGRWLGGHTRMEQRTIEREDGGALRLCVVRAKGKAKARSNATGLLWIHGGGYAIGLPEQGYLFVDRFCRDGSCVVVSPDYRRSTDAPYPAALSDCCAALEWMREHSAELGIRDDQLFVGGDSAGGGLCAAVCLYARDAKRPAVAFQMPLYPMLDDRMGTQSAMDNDAPVWNSRLNEAAWKLYLRGVEDVPPYAAPARAKELAGMPPTCTFVGTIEPFHDETAEFIERLRYAGVAVYFREFEGCFHAFDMLCPGSRAAKEATAFLLDTFRYAQGHCFAPQSQCEAVSEPYSSLSEKPVE